MIANSLAAYSGRNQIEANYIPFDTTQITSAGNYSQPRAGDPCHPLASGAHPPAVAFQNTGQGWWNAEDRAQAIRTPEGSGSLEANLIAHTLKAEGHDASEDGTGRGVPLVSFRENASFAEHGFDINGTLNAENHHALASPSMVRRLTPTEAELLQGFPPGWTCLCGVEPYTTATCRCPDSPRYRALGNAVTVDVISWIGRRLAALEQP